MECNKKHHRLLYFTALIKKKRLPKLIDLFQKFWVFSNS